jgi:hypothetical protein
MGVPSAHISSDYRLDTSYATACPHSSLSLEDPYSPSSGTRSSFTTHPRLTLLRMLSLMNMLADDSVAYRFPHQSDHRSRV